MNGQMSSVAEKIERLPAGLRLKAEGYVDALAQIAAEEDRHFRADIEEGLADIAAGRVHSDEEVWRQMEKIVGPIDAGKPDES